MEIIERERKREKKATKLIERIWTLTLLIYSEKMSLSWNFPNIISHIGNNYSGKHILFYIILLNYMILSIGESN